MARCWVFVSKNRENICRAYEESVWGFWDKDVARSRRSKLARNWRSFLRLYNSISGGDLAFLQTAGSGDIHAVGVVRERFYDDQTPIWDQEIEERRALYPWRVSSYIFAHFCNHTRSL